MKILAYDVQQDPIFAQKWRVHYCSLKKILKNSDFVSIHLPLTEKTKDMISHKELKMMKKSAYLINTSRGGIVNEDALIEALSKRQIAGAALDVFCHEPLRNLALLKLNNIITTPHIGGCTHEAVDRLVEFTVMNILKVKSNQKPLFMVNNVG